MRPLEIRSYRQRRHMRNRRIAVLLVIVVIVGPIAYLLFGPSSKTKSPNLATKPVGPPMEIALVTEIGSGPAVGTGDTLSIIDLATGQSRRIRTVRVGSFPDAIAVTPDHRWVYVTNYNDNSVTPVSLLTGQAGRSIPAGSGPAGIAITPNGRTAYVTDAGSTPLGDMVTPIDLRTGHVLKSIRVGLGPEGIAITPDGTMAYVANSGAIVAGQNGAIGHTVTPIDLMTKRALHAVQVGNAPVALAVSRDGSTVFVTNSYSGSVSPISVAGDLAGTPIQLTGTPQAVSAMSGADRMLVASGTSTGADNVTTIDVVSQTVLSTVTVPANPTAVVSTADDATTWMISGGTDALVPIDLKSASVMGALAVHLSGGPYALALTTVPSSTAATLFTVQPTHHTKLG